MKLIIAALLCGMSNVGFSADERDTQIIKSVSGCYTIEDGRVEVWPDALAEDDATLAKLGQSNKICLTDTQNDENRIAVTFFNAKNEAIVGPWLYSVAGSQPRCPACYNLKGVNGSFNFDGQDNFHDQTQPIKINAKIKELKSAELIFFVNKHK